MRAFSATCMCLPAVFVLLLFSCVSSPKEQLPPVEPQTVESLCSRSLSFSGIKSAEKLAAFFSAHNPDYPGAEILTLARIYIDEAAAEHINSDIAFVQMCLETGFLRFGNLVTPDMHNYCGLGSMDASHPGERFETQTLGVRAHIQHLQAYATDESVPLNKELVDPRYRWVHKARHASTIFDLANTWAMDNQYGEKLNRLLTELDTY